MNTGNWRLFNNFMNKHMILIRAKSCGYPCWKEYSHQLTNFAEKYLEYKILEIKIVSQGRIRVIKKLSETSSNRQEIHKKAVIVTAHIL